MKRNVVFLVSTLIVMCSHALGMPGPKDDLALFPQESLYPSHSGYSKSKSFIVKISGI